MVPGIMKPKNFVSSIALLLALSNVSCAQRKPQAEQASLKSPLLAWQYDTGG
ncbi:MAG TPA: hypothetical protein VIT19_11130 [Pyrinomonadaceae bacterium]